MVATSNNNEIIIAGKGKMSISAKYIFTENFVIRVREWNDLFDLSKNVLVGYVIKKYNISSYFQEFNIVGTGMTEKVIFIRCWRENTGASKSKLSPKSFW